MDNSWGFNPHKASSINVEMDSPLTNPGSGSNADDIVFGFQVKGGEWTAVRLFMDNTGDYIATITPACDDTPPYTENLRAGDLETYLDTNFDYTRRCTLELNPCGTGTIPPRASAMLPPGQLNQFPVRFAIENYPGEYALIKYKGQILQTCGINAGFATNSGFQVYFATLRNNDDISVEYFKLQYFYDVTHDPTMEPTAEPTLEPIPKPPTSVPTTKQPRFLPPERPSQSPSQKPSKLPTKSSSTAPSETTDNSSASPSKNPTSVPTPNRSPSGSPASPSPKATDMPTDSESPSKAPSPATSSQPTATVSSKSTTKSLSTAPTSDPTNALTNTSSRSPSSSPTTVAVRVKNDTDAEVSSDLGKTGEEDISSNIAYMITGIVVALLILCTVSCLVRKCQNKLQNAKQQGLSLQMKDTELGRVVQKSGKHVNHNAKQHSEYETDKRDDESNSIQYKDESQENVEEGIDEGENEDMYVQMETTNRNQNIDINNAQNDEIEDLFQPGPSTEGHIEQMNDDELSQWLKEVVKLPQYYDTFVKNGIDSLELMAQLESKENLNDLGITQTGHQIIIMNCVRKLDINDPNKLSRRKETDYID